MSLKIKAIDLTGGWNLNKYSGQKGHKIHFSTNFHSKVIKNIKWKFSTGQTSTSVTPIIVLKTPLFNIPGEGFVDVNVCIISKCGYKYRAHRRILIVPKLECELQCIEYVITNDTKCIELECEPACAVLALGEPFEGNPDYACGGACFQTCPVYNAFYTPLKGGKITEYGKHKIWAQGNIYGPPEAHEMCVELYQNNLLGRKAKYPPLVRYVNITPNNLNLIFSDQGTKNTNVTIDGLSAHMLPTKAKIIWLIYRDDKLIKKIVNQNKNLCFSSSRSGNYKVKSKIFIPKIATTRISETFTVN